jgi:hypothetical protein
MDEPLVPTDCCGRLLPESATLKNDVHYTDLCPSCLTLDGSPHETHITCLSECPGRDWIYTREDKS